MRITGARSSVGAVSRQTASDAQDWAPPEAECRALIAIEAPRPTEHSPRAARHPSAPFVAHLIATRMEAPQTRARRRAGPDEAISVYRSMTKPVSSRPVFRTRI